MTESRLSHLQLPAAAPNGVKPLVFLRVKEVCERIGVKKTKLYALLGEGHFPMPAKIGKASVWAEAEIEAYMAERMAARFTRRGA